MRQPPSLPTAPCWLYELLDEHGSVLYIGITCMPRERMTTHRREKPWWPQVAVQRWSRFETRTGAERHEAALIEVHRPPHNTARNPRLAFLNGTWPPEPIATFEVAC